MDVSELVSNARSDFLDDENTPYQWSTAKLTRFAEEGILEACKRAPLIERVSNISVSIGVADYTLDDTVRQITVAKLDLVTTPLTQTTDAELSIYKGSSWRVTTGTPQYYVRSGRSIRLYPVPIVADTLVVSHTSLPDYGFDIAEINPVYHAGIVHYIAYKAYNMRDPDTFNPVKASEHLNEFNNYFGLPKSAKFDAVSQNTPMYGSIIGGRMA